MIKIPLPTSNLIHLPSVPNDTAKTYIVSQMLTPLSKENRVIFWLCKNNEEAKSIYENLKFWQGVNKDKIKVQLVNPENSTELSIINYLSAEALSRIEWAKEDQLFKQSQIIITTPKNLQHLNSSQLIITTIQGQTLHPQSLAKKLSDFGYDRNTQADQPGAFAIHGDIIDIWSPQLDKPTKIELEYDKVTKINMGSKNVSQIDIIPCKIMSKSMNKETNNHEIMKSLNHFLCIMCDPDETTLSQFQNNKKIIFESLAPVTSDQLPVTNTTFYHNNLNTLVSDLKKYQKQNYQIILATNQEKSLKQLFKEKNLKIPFSIFHLPSSHVQGFNFKNKFLLLTDYEIFGRSEAKTLSERSKPKSKQKIKAPSKKQYNNITIQQLNNIQPGDFVVHEDHGIAIYRGTTTQLIDNIKKEFFILEYKDNDKLYVPVELADKIDKYIGLANPPIHRLHGGMWYQIKRKIKEQAEKTAKELLDLYAQREIAQTPAFGPKTLEERELENSFPYEETPDQTKTIREVENDLMQEKPADRLICGDVGFGKTEVAIRAAFKAVMNNRQVVLLCPTTILAQQHYDTFISRLKNFPVNVEVLSRFKSKSEQNKTITKAKNGTLDILIGTHRLLSKDISFKNLGLIIIDEEQRFGVEHKEKLKKLRTNAHVLTLTATPIPRTLNFALSGLRDISIIETPPPGRQKIETTIEQYNDERVKQALEKELERQGQIYFVHNQVETIDFATKKISALVPKARIAIAHGQMPEDKLAKTMSDFDNLKIDVLVCSTIIENGLDLPNVNTLIVDNATKFGLAQLYQLRGRVGRSDRQAYAYFFYQRLTSNKKNLLAVAPQNGAEASLTQKELARLQALKQAEELGSGFQLALRDLEIRGVGNILGKKQHGAVAAIGLSLYTRLLSNAVEELKTGLKIPDIPEITIDLPLELGIPKELEPNEAKRLNLYQRLASITNLNDLAKIRESLARKDSHPIREKSKNIQGGLHSPQTSDSELRGCGATMQNLFDVLEIKLLAQKTNISSIDTSFGLSIDGTRKKKISIKFKEPLDQTKFQKLLDTQPDWKQSANQIKIYLEGLGENWLEELKQTIKIFKK